MSIQAKDPPIAPIPVMVNSGLDNADRWQCSVSQAIAAEYPLGSQLRVRRNAQEFAAYTVSEVRAQDPDNMVRMTQSGRQRLGTGNTFGATLRPVLATHGMTDDEVKNTGDFIERLDDNNNHQGLIVLAPHGGGIEFNTDEQAERVAALLPNADVSTWRCKGWRVGGGSYDRWHVTSTVINPISFPRLALIANRDFAYSVSFHGMSGSGVLIGGGGPSELKQMLRQAILSVVGNNSVTIAQNGDQLGGSSPDNITNWLTAGGDGGIQIEQSPQVRDDYWSEVAEAVAEVFSGLV